MQTITEGTRFKMENILSEKVLKAFYRLGRGNIMKAIHFFYEISSEQTNITALKCVHTVLHFHYRVNKLKHAITKQIVKNHR